MVMLSSCRPPQEATEYQITKLNLQDGDIIDDSPKDEDGNPTLYYGEEKFVQAASAQVKAVDIVWVIDNSGSMSDEQQNLSNNFESFINTFLNNGQTSFPFKMAVTTTEAYRSGKDFWEKPASCGGCDKYDLPSEAADNDLNQMINDFKEAVNVGIEGSGIEKSLYSAHTMTDRFQSWFGGDDTLSVYILVSDEQEQSHVDDSHHVVEKAGPLYDENGEQYNLQKWAQKIQSFKSNSAMTRFFPIVRINPIPGEFGDGDVGDRYLQLANLTNGTRSDIDKPFNGILEGISNTIVSLVDSFVLKGDREIQDGSIQVLIDGRTNNDWTYSNKAIKFTTPPADEAEITVIYSFK